MFNLQPGASLGTRWHRNIALGLGWYRKKIPSFYGGRREEFELQKRIFADDDEIIELLAAIMPRINERYTDGHTY